MKNNSMKKAFGGLILDTSFRILVPFTLVYGMYILTHGEYSPGGGFQAGALVAVGIVLVRMIQGGDKEAFGELYRLTSPKAYFVAFQIVRNEQDAEDILQETYIKVLEKIDEIDTTQSFMGWIYRVVSNKSKNLLKNKNMLNFESYEEEVFEDLPEERAEFNPEENLNQSEVCREVMAAIDELSEEKRICVIMKYFGEMTVAEVADSLEVPESTVRNRLFVARKELKKKLEKKESTALYSAAPIGIVIWALAKTSETVSTAFAISGLVADLSTLNAYFLSAMPSMLASVIMGLMMIS